MASVKKKNQAEVCWAVRIPLDLAAHVEAQVRVTRIKKSEVIRDAITLYMHLCTQGYDFKESTAIRAIHEQVDLKLQARRAAASQVVRETSVID